MAGNSGHASKDIRLNEIAEQQHGVVSRAQLLALGFGARAIEARLRQGRLHRLHRGVYVVGLRRVSSRGRWLGAVLACGNDAILSHRSAAAAWGLVRRNTAPVDVTCARSRDSRAGIRTHEGRIAPEERTSLPGEIPISTVARTLFDFAEVADLPRLERAWEEADRLGLLQLREVERVCARNPGRHALRPIDQLLSEARVVIPTRSPLEDRFLVFCRAHGLPPPATNVFVLGHETDAYWPAGRLVVEVDGFAFHGHRAAIERDNARIAALQAAGYLAIRVTHHRIEHDATGLAAEIRALLSLGEGRAPGAGD